MLISLTLTPTPNPSPVPTPTHTPNQAVQLVLSLLRQLSADSDALPPGLSAEWLAEHLPALPYAEAVTRRAATCSRKVGAHLNPSPSPNPSPNPNQAATCPPPGGSDPHPYPYP